MIQKIEQINVQPVEQGPAGGKRAKGADDFQSMMGSAVRRADAGKNPKDAGKTADGAEDKPVEEAGGKRTDHGAEQQSGAMRASVPVSPYPAGFLLPSDGSRTLSDAAKTAALGTIGGIPAPDGQPTAATAADPAAWKGGGPQAPPGAEIPLTEQTQQSPPQNSLPLPQASESPPQAGTATAVSSGEAGQQAADARGAMPEAVTAPEKQAQVPKRMRAPAGLSDGEGSSGVLPDRPESASPEAQTERVSQGENVSQDKNDGSGGEKSGQAPSLGKQPVTRYGDGTEARQDASAAGLSDLYGNGNVVIRVSGETAERPLSPLRQVANAAADQLQKGKNEFKMELYPQSLGKVSVRLTSEKGLLTVEIAASDPKTQSLLLSGSDEIRSILQSSAGQPVQTVFPDRQAPGWYGGQPEQDGGGENPDRRHRKKEDAQDGSYRIDGVNAGMNTGDFLAMIRSIGAFAR